MYENNNSPSEKKSPHCVKRRVLEAAGDARRVVEAFFNVPQRNFFRQAHDLFLGGQQSKRQNHIRVIIIRYVHNVHNFQIGQGVDLDGRVLRQIIKPRPSFGYFSSMI